MASMESAELPKKKRRGKRVSKAERLAKRGSSNTDTCLSLREKLHPLLENSDFDQAEVLASKVVVEDGPCSALEGLGGGAFLLTMMSQGLPSLDGSSQVGLQVAVGSVQKPSTAGKDSGEGDDDEIDSGVLPTVYEHLRVRTLIHYAKRFGLRVSQLQMVEGTSICVTVGDTLLAPLLEELRFEVRI
jgi:hypothetical protein